MSEHTITDVVHEEFQERLKRSCRGVAKRFALIHWPRLRLRSASVGSYVVHRTTRLAGGYISDGEQKMLLRRKGS